jgi:hypothetical protein
VVQTVCECQFKFRRWNSVWDDHGFGIVWRPKKLLNNSHQQVRAGYQTHLALQRLLFIATSNTNSSKKFTRAVDLYPMSWLRNKPSDESDFVINYFSYRKTIVLLKES